MTLSIKELRRMHTWQTDRV